MKRTLLAGLLALTTGLPEPALAGGLPTSCLTPTARRIIRAVGGRLVSTCRRTLIAGTRRWSAHSQGMAIDIVPRRRAGAEARGRAAGATCVIRYSWSPHLHFDHRDRC